jgi:hypothetical protein
MPMEWRGAWLKTVTKVLLSPIATALAWLAVFASCSASDPRPPDLGDCKSSGPACSGGVVGGSGSTGDSGVGVGACATTAADSQCTQCGGASCCAQDQACSADTDCVNLLSCEQGCGGTSACISGCQQQSPNGVTLLANLTTCLDADCPVCSQLGTGDSCISGVACNAGLSCNGLWCTKPCARASDCLGLGGEGGNVLGFPNECILTASAGDSCVPGCASDADCESFPGTFCFAQQSVDGLSVSVCSSIPDAGRE